MRHGRAVGSMRTPLWLVACLLLAACAGGEQRGGDLRWVPAEHTVKPGETLYGISWQYRLDYRRVARWNRIDAPYRIQVGQDLRLYSAFGGGHGPRQARGVSGPAGNRAAPPTESREPATPRRATASKPHAESKRADAPAPSKPARPARAATRPAAGSPVWQWPLEGRLLGGFSTGKSGRHGLKIAANQGHPVYAAAHGRVVYSGSGLIGYGRLVIIKHNETFLSAYAHAKVLLVEEGERVKAGQQIAEVGSTGATERPMLYFEIRRDGKPVDPLLHLPKRKR